MSQNRMKLIVPILVVVGAVGVAVLIASARKAPPRVERPALGPLVEVLPVSVSDEPVGVTGHGEVVAKVSVEVVPQVAGLVVKVHPSMVAGGFFRAGDALVLIDPRDYELAVERADAAVARAQVSLEREQAEADVARQEWDGLHPGEEPSSGLVVREPQVRQAQAELEAARADLETARLSLSRTSVSVPFDGVVVSKSVDLGQFVSTGSKIATVYGTDVVEVRVPMESRELRWFTLPDQNGGAGPRAEVSAEFAGERHTWQGRVARMEAEVDRGSRMIHVVVEVEDPYESSEEHPPLLPGTFVDTRIFGNTASGVVIVPRHAVREGGSVWVYEDGVLSTRDVEILRSDREQVLVAKGLADGDLVIVSALDAVTDGMAVRAAGTEENEGDAS